MSRKVLTIAGVALLSAGAFGPLTYADDLRHVGEVATVVGFLMAGLLLVSPKLMSHWRCGQSLPWGAPFVLLGLAVGVFLDKAMIGVLLGACFGVVAIWWQQARCLRVAA